jgi:methionyl-tRNA formyltransferase
MNLSSICISVSECRNNVTILKLHGSGDAGSITSMSIVPSSNQDNSSTLTIQATLMEVNGQHVVTILATWVVHDISALLQSALISGNVATHSSHGVKFWNPYELNSQLPLGHFRPAAQV